MRIANVDRDDAPRPVGAAVLRAQQNRDVTLDLGPADGAALWRLELSHAEASQLRDALTHILTSGGESILFLDD